MREILELLPLLIGNLVLFILFVLQPVPPLMFLLRQVLLSLLVQLAYRLQVVVGTAVSLDVDAHGLEHFEVFSVAVHLEELRIVLLEETAHRRLVLGGVVSDRVVLKPLRETTLLVCRRPVMLLLLVFW